MKLLSQKVIRGANKEFTFEHKVKGEKRTFVVSAINETNANRKFWQLVKQAYKELKQA